uniref:Uncharacterized protein n=1 Tax=Populus trichocarpa TaxID=3694 RepID=A0A2K2BK64_POPTR
MDQEISELCNSDMSSFLPPPYKNISNMICRPVWNTFLLRYHEKEDNVVNSILSAVYTTGWVAMGKGQARIKESCLQVTRLSQDIEEAGELDLTKVPPAVVIHGAMIYKVFQAKFENPLTSQPIILAFGASYPNHYRLSSHDDKTTILFDFTAGSMSKARINPGKMKKNHGVLGTLAWAS